MSVKGKRSAAEVLTELAAQFVLAPCPCCEATGEHDTECTLAEDSPLYASDLAAAWEGSECILVLVSELRGILEQPEAPRPCQPPQPPETEGQGQAIHSGATPAPDTVGGAPAPAPAPPRDAKLEEDTWTVLPPDEALGRLSPITMVPGDEALARNEPAIRERITIQEAGARALQDLADAEKRRAEFADDEARIEWEDSPGPASDPVSECREALNLLVLRALGDQDDIRDLLLDTRPTATQARFTGDAAYDMARAAALLATDMARAAAGADLSDSVRARAQDYLLPMLRNGLAACIGYLREFTGPGPTPEGVRALFPEAKT